MYIIFVLFSIIGSYFFVGASLMYLLAMVMERFTNFPSSIEEFYEYYEKNIGKESFWFILILWPLAIFISICALACVGIIKILKLCKLDYVCNKIYTYKFYKKDIDKKSE